MGSYRGRRKGGQGSGPYFGSPKLPKGRKGGRKSGKEGSAGKSPLAVHFFFWIVLITMFMTIFGVFQTQIESVVLWNDIYTMFGVISYWDATIGWLITMMFAASIDMILVTK